MKRRAMLCAGLGVFGGCSEDETPDSNIFRFVSGSIDAVPAIGFRDGGFTNGALRLVLVARGLSDLFGLAIEIGYPAGLRFESFLNTDVFPLSTELLIKKLSETAIQLAVAPVGTPPTLPGADYDLGTIVLSQRGDPSGGVDIVGARSEVFAQNGFPRRGVTFVGGRIERAS